MGWIRDRVREAFGFDEPASLAESLEARREAVAERMAEARAVESLPVGMAGLDTDEDQFRRLSDGSPVRMRRDLTLVQQDRALNVSWLLVETNPMAKRVLELMRDLVVGEGVKITGKDERTAEPLAAIWRAIVGGSEVGDLYYAAALNGELIIPASRNPVSGAPRFGFLDPLSVSRVEFDQFDARQPIAVWLKRSPGETSDGTRLEVIRENPETGAIIPGDVFFWRLNALPNSGRGRPDLLTLADYIDLYDQLLYGNAETQRALSSFVWDLEVETTDPKVVEEKVRALGRPKAGQVYGHNSKEKLSAITPALHSSDRAESVKTVATHIAGGMGYPLTWLGFTDSNKATIEGQNDISMKTPKRRQNQFRSFLELMIRYGVDGVVAANPAYYRGKDLGFTVEMPEIAAKDISRVGGVFASVVSGLDTALANKTISRRAAVVVTASIAKHLGVDLDIEEVIEQADAEAAERQGADDERAAMVAAANAGGDKGDDDGPARGIPLSVLRAAAARADGREA